MGNANDLHVVFGATGGAGGAVVRELAAQGKRVRAVIRSGRGSLPAGVEVFKADLTDAASVRAACQGAAVVYQCANVPYKEWHAQFPAMMAGAIAGASAANARLVFADNLYMYGKVDGPMTESTPYRPNGPKGELRAKLANTLMDAHKSGAVRATIGRASDYYGGGTNAIGGDLVFAPLMAGKKVNWVGSLDAPHTMSYVENFAKGLVTLGERDEALGEIWHIPSGEPLTGRQFLTMAFEAAGKPAQIGNYARPMLILAGLFIPAARDVQETLYQFEAPFIMDTSKYERTFGAGWLIPHREAIRRTVDWYRQRETRAA
jgi:nucleoside-diphosphate-sugar epimerase